MSDDDLIGLEDMEEVFDTIVMKDDNGNSVDFTVIDGVQLDGISYLLVVETEFLDDESADADILKEIAEDGEELVYEFIQDDEEFQKVAAIFQENDDEYEIEL